MKTSKLFEARENANDLVAIVFSYTSDWLKGWSSFQDQSQRKVK